MAKRKTISVEELKNRANAFLLNSLDSKKEARDAMIDFIENVLRDTGNYNGFRYLTIEDMNKSTDGVSVGVYFIRDDNGRLESNFMNTDYTRVAYK